MEEPASGELPSTRISYRVAPRCRSHAEGRQGRTVHATTLSTTGGRSVPLSFLRRPCRSCVISISITATVRAHSGWAIEAGRERHGQDREGRNRNGIVSMVGKQNE